MPAKGQVLMGNLKTFFVAMALLLSGSAIVAGPSEDQLGIFSQGNDDLFVVRAGKDLLGAKVEIFSDTGEFVTAQIVNTKKLYIDFGSVTEGTYTIRVSKGNIVKEFSFEKK